MVSKLTRFCNHLIEVGWISAAITTALYFNVYSSRIFEPDKIALLRSIASLVALAWLVKIIDQRKAGLKRTISFKGFFSIPLMFPVNLLIISYLISSLFSVVPLTSWLGSYQRLQGTYTTFSYLILFASLIFNLENPQQIKRLISVMIAVSFPIAMYGLLQRYHLDPIPWGGDVSERIASTMGNSIFVAAYLIMVFPLTLSRVISSFGELAEQSTFSWMTFTKSTIYLFLIILQVVALFFSGSRGPALGWMSSVLIFSLLWFWWRKQKTTALLVVAGTLLLGLFILIFNLPNSPFEALKENPAIGRFGQLLDPQSNNARVRTYIWQGAVQLFSNLKPLEYPDGRTDQFYFLRPLIGYGPESMYVAYNRFYPPQLTLVEKRNASPDRSHNETWDSLVITGVFGFIVYLLLFSSVFYYGFKRLKLIETHTDKLIFLLLILGLGIVFSLFMVFWRGIEYFGIAFPIGMISGLFIYLVYKIILMNKTPNLVDFNQAEVLLLIALLSVFVAHLIEINFGIAIVVTRTYFWLMAGILVILVQPLSEITVVETAPSPAKIGEKKRKKRTEKFLPQVSAENRLSNRLPALQYGMILALILIVIGFDFINSSRLGSQPFQIIWESFTQLRADQITSSPGVLLLIALTCIIGSVIFLSEHFHLEHTTDLILDWLTIIVSGIMLTFLYWFAHATALAAITASQVTNMTEVLGRVNSYEGLLSNFYFWFFIAFGLLALVFYLIDLPKIQSNLGSLIALLSFFFGILLWVLVVNQSNVRVIKADIDFKLAEPFAKEGTWPVSIEIYKHGIELAPREDYYYLFLGRAYLEQGKSIEDAQQRDAFFSQAENDLLTAQKLNPLNTDHTANLARLYSMWSIYTSDSELKQKRFEQSNIYFQKALSLSPHSSRLWDEWAVLLMNNENTRQDALKKLFQAYELDPTYDWTAYLFGEYYAALAKRTTGQEETDAIINAISNYQKAANLTADTSLKVNYLLTLTQFAVDQNQIKVAIEALHQIISYVPNSSETWKYENLLAQLYFGSGDRTQALEHAQRALSICPQDQKQQIEELIQKIGQ